MVCIIKSRMEPRGVLLFYLILHVNENARSAA